MPWAHPVGLAVIAAHTIVACTRVPAAEIDHGTIDILLALPVSRWEVHRAEAAAWSASALVVVLCGAAGNRIGNQLIPVEQRLAATTRLYVVVNLYAFALALGSITWIVAALSDRRGRALAGAFAIFIGSMLVSYLAQFVALAKYLSIASILRYFQPIMIHQRGTWPVVHLVVLCAIAVVGWMLAGWIFARRDLPTG